MRFSYYSDRRFKRGSLAHELCSKIEVTKGKGEKRKREREEKLPSRPGLLVFLSPDRILPLASIPFLRTSWLFLFVPLRRFRSPPSLIRAGRLTLLLFQRYIFSSHRKRILLSSFSLYLFRFLSCSLSFLFSIRRFDPVRGVEGNPQNLLEILWIIINAYAVVESIDRPVWSLPFISRPPPSFRPFLSSSSFAAIGGFRYVRSEERRRRRRYRRRRHEIIQSNEARFVWI